MIKFWKKRRKEKEKKNQCVEKCGHVVVFAQSFQSVANRLPIDRK
jgi:hypothetical protein